MKNSIFKNLFALVITLSAYSSFSQNSEVKVVDLKPAFSDNKFPEVQISSDLKAQNKINTFLQLEHLEHLPNIFQSHPYEKLKMYEDSDIYRTFFHDWKVNESPKNILSLIIEAEFTGAYSEGYTIYNNFDVRTGNKITANNLFSSEGKKTLRKLLNQKVTLEIKNFLKNIKLKQSSNNEDKELIEEQIEIYEGCLENNESYKLEYYDITFNKDKITFIRGRCSNHAMWSSDELDTFEFNFTYKELKKYLSEYGKSLCFENVSNINSTTIDGKLFKGKIDDKYPITALVQNINSDNNITIYYWYDKYNLPIEWSGKFEKNHFHLNEYNETNQEIAIEANYINNKIVGTWTNKTTNKTLKLELKEY